MATLNFLAAPQAGLVMNQSNNEIYLFDGITKVNYSLTSKFDENPDSDDRARYTNGAKNEQDKIVFDVVMSDIHNLESDLTKDSGGTKTAEGGKFLEDYADSIESRSARALSKLWKVKSDRNLLVVMTRQETYRDMVLSGVNIIQDENHPYGWEGQLTFQKKVELKAENKATGSSRRTGKTSGNNNSTLYDKYGRIVGSGGGNNSEISLSIDDITDGKTYLS